MLCTFHGKDVSMAISYIAVPSKGKYLHLMGFINPPPYKNTLRV